ncbi:DUF6463 family protein [Ruegeria jejuensis]|uniref:DUF6463 family protein n=1 Tax=Ruegeria jejuensis TaxID=3233338 RepID=UPI00355B15CF
MNWVGFWMVGVAGLHTMLGVYLYGGTLAGWLQGGLFNTVQSESDRVALWFLTGGLMMFTIGLCLLNMPTKPRAIGFVLLVIALTGICLLPKSGFWFLLPPAIGIILKGQSA